MENRNRYNNLFLIGFSFFQINSNKKVLVEFDQVQIDFDKYNLEFSKLIKKKREMDKSLELGKMVNYIYINQEIDHQQP